MGKLTKCPFCDSECVHIESVKINRGGEITKVTHKGTEMEVGEAECRGAKVYLTLWCEGGHRWDLTYHFHKGSLIEETNEINELFPNVHELWRD